MWLLLLLLQLLMRLLMKLMKMVFAVGLCSGLRDVIAVCMFVNMILFVSS